MPLRELLAGVSRASPARTRARETSLELIARKKDVARLLIPAAELWAIILFGFCEILKTARKTAKLEEG